MSELLSEPKLLYLPRFAPGVILLRLAGLSAARKAEIVAAAISQHIEELPCAFAVVTSMMVRIRRQVFS